MNREPITVHDRIAERVRELRAQHGLSLDALAAKSGVSRSMISLIERGESSPTAVVLERLAAGLQVTMASMFDLPADQPYAPASPISRYAEQAVWQDPGSGYARRNVSPAGTMHPVQIVDVRFPPMARVAFETSTRDVPASQQLWLLEGQMVITVGDTRHTLHAGDCLFMQLDKPIMFHNPTAATARYAVIVLREPATGDFVPAPAMRR